MYTLDFVKKGRVGTNDCPGVPGESQVGVVHDGHMHIYNSSNTDEFGMWAEDAWGLPLGDSGEWCGNVLHLD